MNAATKTNTDLTTIAAALEAAFPGAAVAVVDDRVTIKLMPRSGHGIGASFRPDGDSIVVRGWGGESRVKADPARCVKSAQRMIAASDKQYGLA